MINIGVEGLMLTAAFFGFWVALATGVTWLGVGAGIASSAALAAVFAGLTVTLHADQIVVGTGVNLFAVGLTGALYRGLFGDTGVALVVTPLPLLKAPALASVPILGALSGQNLLTYGGMALVPVVWWGLSRTGAGLSARAVGEDPRAADAAGVKVRRVRVTSVIIGGALVGLGGAFLSLGHAQTFTEGMSAGKGFIALAIVIFGRWNPWGVWGAATLFGAANALQFTLQSQGSAWPYQFFLALPYLVTLLVLALGPLSLPGRKRSRATVAPAALAQPYRP